MKQSRYPAYLAQTALILTLGCSTVQQQQPQQTELPLPAEPAARTAINFYSLGDSLTSDIRYEAETDIFQQILANLNEAEEARAEGYYGLAETKVEDACILAKEVDLDLIQDETLCREFKNIMAALAQENGRILFESSIIAEEDPMTWIEGVNMEQFRAGQWTDEELEKIVNKIALKSNVPIEFNQSVRNAIYFFQKSRRKEVEAWISRMGKYQPMIERILTEEGIPSDMVYLAMIESGFNPKAYSRARAAGMWQFIYTTGKIYGLNRNQWVDERYDPVKATYAAARYLNDVYKLTDDWNNVMAAYNCGEGRITRQLDGNENLEYWDMKLPSETRSYVPFYMAAVIICKAPEIFGFDHVQKQPPLEYDLVDVRAGTRLSDAAKCCDTDAADLKSLNPELLTDRVPPDKTYQLRIPKNTKEMFAVEYAKLPAQSAPAQPATNGQYVAVRSGDSFSSIADRNRVSVNALRQANPQITNINRLTVGQRIYLPGSANPAVASASTATASRTTTASTQVQVNRTNTTRYTVQKNDTIGTIATKFKTTYRVIQTLNNMGSSTKIYAGDRLIVPGTATASSTQANTQTASKSSPTTTHIVQRNETLETIARRYGTNFKTIQSLNKMGSGTKIVVGQKLVVPALTVASSATTQSGAKSDVVHIVQKNDTIFDIAQKYGVKYQTLIDFNKISDYRKIKPGDRIVIPK